MTTNTAFTPLNPDFAQVVRAGFDRQGFMRTVGAQLTVVEPGRVVIEVPWAASLTQQHGFFHGGLLGTLGDNVGGFASITLQPAGSEVLTVEYKINFIKPAKGELIRAEGLVLRAGKSITVTRMDVTAIDGGKESTVAVLQGTFMRFAV